MNKKPHILITNDDGIHAQGIRHLWESLQDMASVSVIAPRYEQSAVGLGITIRNPLQIEKLFWSDQQVWAINGTPADCVKLAVNVILREKPDLIVSGINRGANSGRNLLYSGTVAAAIEGSYQGIPSIALSCYEYDAPDYQAAKPLIPPLISHILTHPLPEGTLLNVNFPNGSIKGIKYTRQGKECWAEEPSCRTHPTEGHEYYWLGAKLKVFDEHEDSDVSWIRQGYAAAVPIQVGELTDFQLFHSQRDVFDRQFANLTSS